VMNWHNSFRLKQGVAIKNAWNREVPSLNSFFGLMNKSSFVNMLNSINLSFEGEYIDKEFMEQINTLTLVPSRRSNAMTDPVLELQVYFHHPSTFKIWLLDNDGNKINTIFDDSMLQYNNGTETIDFWTACDQIKNYLSLEYSNAQSFVYPSKSIKGYFGYQSYAYENLVILQYYKNNDDIFGVVQTANTLPVGQCEIVYGIDKATGKAIFFIKEPDKTFLSARFIIKPTSINEINPYNVEIVSSVIIKTVSNDAISFTIRDIDSGLTKGQTFILSNDGSTLDETTPSYENIHTSYAIVSQTNNAIDMLHIDLRQDINAIIGDTKSKFISR